MKIAGIEDDLSKVTVADYMVRNPTCLKAGDTIKRAIILMRVGRFRHLPIADASGMLLTVISVRDVLNFVADAFDLSL